MRPAVRTIGHGPGIGITPHVRNSSRRPAASPHGASPPPDVLRPLPRRSARLALTLAAPLLTRWSTVRARPYPPLFR